MVTDGKRDSVCSSAHQGLLFPAFLAALHTAFFVLFPGLLAEPAGSLERGR